MTDYTKTTNFASKDALPSGNANKIVKGTEINTEFDNIATAVTTKANIANPAFTGVVSFPDGSASNPSITNTGDTNAGLFFSAADTLAFSAGGTAQVVFADGVISPVTDSDVDLGTNSLRFKDAYVDSVTVTGNGAITGDLDVDGTIEFDALSGTGSVAITDILDEDDMASNSATALATQQSIKAYVIAQQDTVDSLSEVLALGNTTGDTDISVTDDTKVQFRDSAIYINSSADGQLDIVADTEIQIAATTVDINGAVALNGAVTGATNVTLSGELDAATGDFSGAVDIDGALDVAGTTNLDVVDIDGATQIDATVSVGVDDTGYDVKFFGATSGKSLLWDESADSLIVTGTTTMTGNSTVSGTLGVTGVLTGTSLDISGDIDVDGTTNLDVVDIDGAVDMASTLNVSGNLTVGSNIIASTFTVDAGGDINLDANGGDIILLDNGTGFGRFTNSSTDFVIKSDFQDKDLIFKGNDGGSEITALTLDMSNGGSATFNKDILMGDGNPIRLGDSQDLRIFYSGGSIFQDTTSDSDMFFKGNDGGSTITALTLDMSAAGFATFNDGISAKRHFVQTAGEIEFDFNGIGEHFTGGNSPHIFAGQGSSTTYLAGTLNFQSRQTVNRDINFITGTTPTVNLKVGGDGVVTTGAALTATGVVTANAGVVVDNFTLDGTTLALSSGDMTLDAAGDIILDADGAEIIFKDGGTQFGEIYKNGNDLRLESNVPDGDLVFSGNDNGTGVVALTLDMSAAGAATFNAGATFGSHVKLTDDKQLFWGDGTVSIQGDAANEELSIGVNNVGALFADASGIVINEGGTDRDFRVESNNTDHMLFVDGENDVVLIGKSSGSTSVAGIGATVGSSIGQFVIAKTNSGTHNAIRFYHSGANVGNIQYSDSATSYLTSSDQRLKENIADADDAGSKIDAIQVRKFDWKADGSHQDYGMVAQELDPVAPEAVSKTDDPEDMMGVDYSKLVPMLIKEIQSLRQRVASLEE